METNIIPHGISHLILFVVAVGVYAILFARGHFKIQDHDGEVDGVAGSLGRGLTYAVSTHTLLGDATALPLTPLAKTVAAVHACLAWIVTLLIISIV